MTIIFLKVLGFLVGTLIDPISIVASLVAGYKAASKKLSTLVCAGFVTFWLDTIADFLNPSYEFGEMILVRFVGIAIYVFIFAKFFKLIGIGKERSIKNQETSNNVHHEEQSKMDEQEVKALLKRRHEIQRGRRLAKADLGKKLDDMIIYVTKAELDELYLKYAREYQKEYNRSVERDLSRPEITSIKGGMQFPQINGFIFRKSKILGKAIP